MKVLVEAVIVIMEDVRVIVEALRVLVEAKACKGREIDYRGRDSAYRGLQAVENDRWLILNDPIRSKTTGNILKIAFLNTLTHNETCALFRCCLCKFSAWLNNTAESESA